MSDASGVAGIIVYVGYASPPTRRPPAGPGPAFPGRRPSTVGSPLTRPSGRSRPGTTFGNGVGHATAGTAFVATATVRIVASSSSDPVCRPSRLATCPAATPVTSTGTTTPTTSGLAASTVGRMALKTGVATYADAVSATSGSPYAGHALTTTRTRRLGVTPSTATRPASSASISTVGPTPPTIAPTCPTGPSHGVTSWSRSASPGQATSTTTRNEASLVTGGRAPTDVVTRTEGKTGPFGAARLSSGSDARSARTTGGCRVTATEVSGPACTDADVPGTPAGSRIVSTMAAGHGATIGDGSPSKSRRPCPRMSAPTVSPSTTVASVGLPSTSATPSTAMSGTAPEAAI